MAMTRRTVLSSSAAVVGTDMASRSAQAAAASPGTPQATRERMRARDLDVAPGDLPPGEHNAITDVDGVLVGHVTLDEGASVRTGVTAIIPHSDNVFQNKVPGGVFIGNAFGKLAGSTQVGELGTIETPIVLTNTLSVARGIDGVLAWTLAQPENESVRSINALVGETNDGGLNDIRGRHVTEDHVVSAITTATSGPVDEGSVGAGTGTTCFGWKGGIGTSSRVLEDGYRVGVLVQSNYGGSLRVDGVPIGAELTPAGETVGSGDGSCMMVVATDAPLTSRNLERLAGRAVFAMGRTGAAYTNGSGDYAIAFSTAPEVRESDGGTDERDQPVLPSAGVSTLFEAALDAGEEAIYNSLFMATTVTGYEGEVREEIPLDAVRRLLRRYGRRGDE